MNQPLEPNFCNAASLLTFVLSGFFLFGGATGITAEWLVQKLGWEDFLLSGFAGGLGWGVGTCYGVCLVFVYFYSGGLAWGLWGTAFVALLTACFFVEPPEKRKKKT